MPGSDPAEIGAPEHGRPRSQRERSHFPARPCEGCGVAFTPVRAWHRHCSDRCRTKANRERHAYAMQETIARLVQLAGVGPRG